MFLGQGLPSVLDDRAQGIPPPRPSRVMLEAARKIAPGIVYLSTDSPFESPLP